MARCANCGGLLGPDAEWCGQCFTVVGHREAERPDPPQTAPPPPSPAPTPALAAAAALAAIPPDIQITLAGGSSRGATALSERGKSWVTAVIVLMAAGSDALFYPFVKYMVIYGVIVGAPSAFAIYRLWSRRSVKR